MEILTDRATDQPTTQPTNLPNTDMMFHREVKLLTNVNRLIDGSVKERTTTRRKKTTDLQKE